MVTREKTYTVDEYYALMEAREDDTRYELVEGYLVEMPPPRPINAHIAMLIGTFLTVFVLENDLGYTFGADGGYELSVKDVRIPDVSFVAKDRIITDTMLNLIPGAPDLAVEVISPSETAKSIKDKTQAYFDGGAKVVWIIYPDDKFAEVRTPTDTGFQAVTIDIDGVLTAEPVLPDFELPLSKIFPKIDPKQDV